MSVLVNVACGHTHPRGAKLLGRVRVRNRAFVWQPESGPELELVDGPPLVQPDDFQWPTATCPRHGDLWLSSDELVAAARNAERTGTPEFIELRRRER